MHNDAKALDLMHTCIVGIHLDLVCPPVIEVDKNISINSWLDNALWELRLGEHYILRGHYLNFVKFSCISIGYLKIHISH